MNYGKKSTARKEKELTSKGTMVRKKFSVIFCKTLLICFFLAAVVGICAGIGIFKGIIDSAPDIDDIDASPTDSSLPFLTMRVMKLPLWLLPVQIVTR